MGAYAPIIIIFVTYQSLLLTIFALFVYRKYDPKARLWNLINMIMIVSGPIGISWYAMHLEPATPETCAVIMMFGASLYHVAYFMMMVASALRMFALNDLQGVKNKRIDGAILGAILLDQIVTIILHNTTLTPIVDTNTDQCAIVVTNLFAWVAFGIPVVLDLAIVARLYKYLGGVSAHHIERLLRVMMGFLSLHVVVGVTYVCIVMFGLVPLTPSVRIILVSVQLISGYTSMTLPHIVVQMWRSCGWLQSSKMTGKRTNTAGSKPLATNTKTTAEGRV